MGYRDETLGQPLEVAELVERAERLLHDRDGGRGIALGQFVHPTGVSVSCNGTLTVTDSDNNRVQQFALLAPPPGGRDQVVDGFHRLYYDSGYSGGTWADTRWFGVRTLKCPLDLWIYQEIVHELAPDLIIETGTADGGSGLCEGNSTSMACRAWPRSA